MAERVHYKTIMYDSARWDGFTLRPDDIVISTPPKCGTTWMQMICALLVFQTPDLPQPLDIISPWLDMQTRSRDDIVADLEAQTHRRLIKTHTPLDGIPELEGVTYITIGRDPRDVGVSWEYHMKNTDMIKLFTARHNAVGLDDIADKLAEGPPDRGEGIVFFQRWVDDESPVTESNSLAATLHHLQTFWGERDRDSIVLMHYDDMTRDLGGEMRRLAVALEIEVPEDRWPELVAAARFEEMRGRADSITPESSSDIWIDNAAFFHAGTSGQWRELLGPDDLAHYRERVVSLAKPDLAVWAHNGWNGTTSDW
jgi:aryl sulfotransferase